ncbi:MAG: class I SAM-dependent methyltransferase [Chloroflexota bacterium]
MTITAPFDATAHDYDATFTDTLLGRWLRDIVRERIPVQAGDRVLEIGCGTGEDALWLAQKGAHITATDMSVGMLRVAEQKASGQAVTFRQFDVNAKETYAQWGKQTFDGVFANFGVLNCAEDLPVVAEFLSQHTTPGAWVALVMMNPVCAWEIGWHLAKLDVRRAFRRLKPGHMAHAGSGEQIRVWYPSPGQVRRTFAPWFEHEATHAIGVLLPPSYVSHVVARYPRTFGRLAAFDRTAGTRFYNLSDHYLIVMRRR